MMIGRGYLFSIFRISFTTCLTLHEISPSRTIISWSWGYTMAISTMENRLGGKEVLIFKHVGFGSVYLVVTILKLLLLWHPPPCPPLIPPYLSGRRK